MSHKFVVIIAGGRGERFWPLSRLARPKHLLSIVGDKALLSQTIDRVKDLVPVSNILVITSAVQEAAVRELCSELPSENIVAEPVGRDTAAAVALAAVLVGQRDPNGVFAVLPADHVIHDAKAYRNDLKTAFEAAAADEILVTIGIRPTEPATGFGYIQRGDGWRVLRKRCLWRARRFVEKPNLKKAKTYLSSGDYLWNAGMFIWRVGVVVAGLRKHAPELLAAMEPLRKALTKKRPLATALKRVYPGLVKISVDYALLEKSDNVVVLPASFDWDDVGSWPAVANHLPKDKEGNVSRGEAVIEQGRGNIVLSAKGHLVTVLGTDDLIVVHTEDATLVCPKSRAQELKSLLARVPPEKL